MSSAIRVSGTQRPSCAGSLAVNARISPAVENREDDYAGALDDEVDEVRKSTQHRAMNVTMDARVDPWAVDETFEKVGDYAAELGAKTRLLSVVPVLCLFEVTFSEPSNDDLVLHRLRSRAATSLHGDSAPGFFCRSSKRRVSSWRCESDTGKAEVLASSATVSQIAETSSILSSTLSRLASARSAVFIVTSYLGWPEAHNVSR